MTRWAAGRGAGTNRPLAPVVPATTEGVTDIVAAFDEAVGAVLKRSVAWTLVEGQKSKPANDDR